MSIEKDYDIYIAVCDICGDDIGPFEDFYDAVDAKDVAMMLALLKVARIHNGDKMDSFIDLAGYAACAGEIVGKEAP